MIERDTDTCFLLLSNVPPGTLIGLDANIWRVGRDFRGIRDIPLGVHYLFFNAAASENGAHSLSGLRSSIFLNLNKPCVIRKRWVKEAEEFVDEPESEMDLELMAKNQNEISMYLGSYPKDRLSHWIALSSYITTDVICKLQPSGRYIFSCAQFQSEKSTSQERANLPIPARLRRDSEDISAPDSIASGEEQLPILKKFPETELHLTKLPSHALFPPGSTSEEISRHNIDQTYTLNCILSQFDGSSSASTSSSLSPSESHLLGEFHFSFVVFLLGEVLEGWYHWRRLLALIANCERAISERPRLYKAIITSIYRLLTYSGDGAERNLRSVPENAEAGQTLNMADLFNPDERGCSFDGWTERHGEPAFLPHTLTRLFDNIASAATSDRNLANVLDRAEGLRCSLERRYKVRLSGSRTSNTSGEEIPVNEVNWDTEDAPVIIC